MWRPSPGLIVAVVDAISEYVDDNTSRAYIAASLIEDGQAAGQVCDERPEPTRRRKRRRRAATEHEEYLAYTAERPPRGWESTQWSHPVTGELLRTAVRKVR